MQNPFEKEDHTDLLVGIGVGVAAGIGLGWAEKESAGERNCRPFR